MTDLQTAKNNLEGHNMCLCKNGECRHSDGKGISPLMDLISGGTSLSGYSVADIIVGKAAALLFVKCGIDKVFAKTLSFGGKKVLELFGVYYEYETLTERIVNRTGTDVCPMEKAVWDTEDPDAAYEILKERLRFI